MLESLLFLFTAIIGIITIVLMISSYKSNPFYNVFLLLIIAIASIRFSIHGSYELGLQSFLSSDKGPNSVFYLTIIPCFYLYYKYLSLQTKTYTFKDLKHLGFILLLYLLNTNASLAESIIFRYGRLINLILIGIFVAFYLILIYRLLSKNIWRKKDLLVNNKHFNLVKNWTIYLFTLNILAGFTLTAAIYTEFNSDISLSGKSLAVFLLLFWLFIYFKILFTPEILFGLPILNKKILKFNLIEDNNRSIKKSSNSHWVLEFSDQKNNDQDIKLQEKIMSNIKSYIQEVDKLICDEQVFRNPKSDPSHVAEKLGVPTSHIVYLFKYHSKISFPEYRTKNRIEDSIHLIESGYLKTNTMESLAYKTGFSSYNPFFIAFKKVTGLSPQDYSNSIKD